MATKIRNVIFCLIGVFILCAAIWYKIADTGNFLPDALHNGKTSYLEGKALQPLPSLSIGKFADGTFQDEAEDYLSGCWPARDEAMLSNAALQRMTIEFAATPFGYDVYPTFYGSEVAYDRQHALLCNILKPATNDAITQYEQAAEQYNDFIKRHKDIPVVLYWVDELSSSSNNPTLSLILNPVDSRFLTQHFLDRLDDSAIVIDGTLDSTESWTEEYFRTDHHWNNPIAYDAYCKALDSLAPKSEPCEFDEIVWEGIPFYGSLARTGLYLPAEPDILVDHWIDLGDTTVTINGEEQDADSVDHRTAYDNQLYNREPLTNRYSEYYHNDYELIAFKNANAQSEESLLIVGPSYTNNMERFFSKNFRNVYCFDPRKSDSTLEEIMYAHQADRILFLIGSSEATNASFLGSLK